MAQAEWNVCSAGARRSQRYGEASRANRPRASANPKGRASFRQPQRRSPRPYIRGTTLGNRLCSDANLLRQNGSI
ncbi:hypothetical protein CO676_12495 [Sinorhizobium sp. BJ1]|nr:hypothetical protein CO676_12495 [Sinorhizobium sp. BJ1]